MDNYTQIEFDRDQKDEIQIGKEHELDISLYARPEFLAIQMRQIRLGLEDGLDVTVYNKIEYDWFQMEEIRKGLKAGIQTEMYARPSIDYKRMRQVRKGLQKGIDLSSFIKLEAGILEELREAILAKVAIVDYIKEGYQVEQLKQIRLALQKNLEIRPYISLEHRGASIREIRLGLEKGLSVFLYAGIKYSWQQMREIRLGMEARLDVSCYANPLYSWQQMREIRLGIEEEINISSYCSLMYTASDMQRMRLQILSERTEVVVETKGSEVVDERIAIFVSSDAMEVCVEIRCMGDEDITGKEIVECLKAHGICKGVLENEIEAIASEKKYWQTIVVAKGLHPQKGRDGRYEFYFNTNPTKVPKILPDGSADFKAVSWFEMVKKGQKIAEYFEPENGIDGYTVTGKRLEAHKGKEKNLLSGQGFQLLEDGKTYISLLDGKIDLIDEKCMEISNLCIFDEVNYTTGNIYFEGSVYIKGNVEGNVVIHATENVLVDGFVEACTIRCGGEICLRRGINGGGTGYIEAQKNIMAQFFEGVQVVCGGDVSAHYALNCDIEAKGTVEFYGERGLLLGGRTRAARGIKAYNIGNKMGVRTVLNVGIDDKIWDIRRQLDARIDNVNKELLILNNSYEEFKKKYPPEIRNAMELFLKIENAIYTKQLEMKALSEKKERMENDIQEMKNARIIVNGVLYDGTEVTIDNVKWDVFCVRGVMIRYKKGNVAVEAN